MPTPPPWWTRNPGGAVHRVDQSVEDRPVGDRVRAVAHPLGLAVRRGDRAAVEMVAADDDRRLHPAARHQLVEHRAGAGALAVAEPADARRQPLERHPLAARSGSSAWSLASSGNVARIASSVAAQVLRIARQHRPAERALALAEERPDEQRHEAADRRRRPRLPPPAPGRAGCCRSRRSPRRAAAARASRARASPSRPSRARRTRPVPVARSASAAAKRGRAARSRRGCRGPRSGR